MTPMTSVLPSAPMRTDRIPQDRETGKTPAEGTEGLFESIRRLVAERETEAENAGKPEELLLAVVSHENGSEEEPVAGQESLDGIVMDLTGQEAAAMPMILPTPVPRRKDGEEPGKSSAAIARSALEIQQSHPHSQALLHSRALMYSQAMQHTEPVSEPPMVPVVVVPAAAEADAVPVDTMDGSIIPVNSSMAYMAAPTEMSGLLTEKATLPEGKSVLAEKATLPEGKSIPTAKSVPTEMSVPASANADADVELATTASAAEIEKPLAPLSSGSGSSGKMKDSDNGKDRLQGPSHGRSVQAEPRTFTSAIMAASALEMQGDGTKVTAPQIVRQIVESLEYTPVSGVQELVIRLKPDVFGELHIRLEMKDDVISARIFTDSHPTRVMLSAHLSQLQDALQDKGLSVKDIQVEYTSPDTGHFQSGHPGSESGRRPSPYANHSGHPALEEDEKPAAPAWRTERPVRVGGLDYLA